MSRSRTITVVLAVLAAGAPVVRAAEGGGGGSALIQPTRGTLFWTVLTFLLFSWLLSKFAWKPLMGALDAREASIRESLDTAKRERDEAEKVLAEHKQLVAEAHRERAGALAAAQEDAERLKAEILEEGRRQREKMLVQAEAQVETSLRQAKTELRAVAVDLAIQAAAKLLDKNLDDATQRRLVESHLADLESGGESGPPPS